MLIVTFRGFGIGPRRNAGFTSLSAQTPAQLPAVVPFVADGSAVAEGAGEFRGCSVVTDISRRKHHRCGESAERIDDQMNLRVESAAGTANRLILTGWRAIGVLMHLAVCAVKKDGFRFVAADELLVQEVKEPGAGKAIPKLKDRKPVPELRGQCPPCRTVAQHVPQSVEVLVDIGSPSSAPYVASVSGTQVI